MTTGFEAAVKLLHSPSTWCEGALALARIGDRVALIPLLRAYEAPSEGGRMCLLDAMAALGAADAAGDLYQAGKASDREQRSDQAGDRPSPAERRRLALHLMALFADDRHLPYLEAALTAQEPEVRDEAIRALRSQYRTAGWHATVDRLEHADDPELRAAAASCRDPDQS